MENRSQVLPQTPVVAMPPFKATTTTVVSMPRRIEHRERRVRLAFRIAAVVLAAIHVWADRHSMNPDGINYLDMGEAYLRGDWGMALNAHWSPFYSWLLGLTLQLFRPSPYWEFTAAHLLNFAIFLVALGCFEFLLREVVRLTQSSRQGASAPDGRQPLPAWGLMALGYALFIWTALDFITLRLITPDLLVAAAIYLAAGLTVRMRRGAAGWGTFAALGVVLGVGFLAKAAMFPLAFVILALAFFSVGELRKAAPRVLLAAAIFMLLSGPLIFALSQSKGRLTFSDSGRLTYAWFVNGLPLRHYQGDSSGNNRAAHPTRKVFDKPTVYEFAGPVGGTNPVWYDPSYWYEGVKPRFNLKKQIAAIGANAAKYHRMFFGYLQSSLFVGFFVLMIYAHREWRASIQELTAHWNFLALAVAGLGMFALVYAEARYVAPFVVLWWLGLYAGLRLPGGHESRRLAGSVSLVLVAMLLVLISVETAPKIVAARGERQSNHEAWRVADGLSAAGVRPGDGVALLYPEPQDASPSRMTSWARLARVRVVVEIPPAHAQDYWAAEASVKSQVLETFAKAGAVVVVTEKVPAGVSFDGWQKIGETNYFAYLLPR